MPKLLIKLTPLEPYFFGGERIFEIGDGNKHYFIRSLDTPSQTTLFGALRYIGIKDPAKGFCLNDDDRSNVGGSSFKLNDSEVTGFGRINGISPLYLFSEDSGFLIRTPLDHIVKCAENNANEYYAPFTEYTKAIETPGGVRFLPKDYKAKDGLADSWLALKSRRIYDGLFEKIVQVGVNKKEPKEGFIKKEYKRLRDKFSFAFFADADENYKPYNSIVYLGQGKSPYRAEWSWDTGEPEIPEDLIRSDFAYAQSDTYYPDEISVLYGACKFVCVKTRDFRVFYTDYEAGSVTARFNKGGNIQLIQAGSVFWPNAPGAFADEIRKNKHAAIAGFNQIIIGGRAQ